MNRKMVSLTGIFLAAVVVGSLWGAAPGWAGPQLFSFGPLQTYRGTYDAEPTRGIQPFILQLFAVAGQCLRAEVTVDGGGADFSMALIAPNGTVWRNDDGGACANCPLIKADPTPDRGWYTLHITRFAGVATGADFDMTYQTLATGNAACASPTPAEIPTRSPEKTAKLGQNQAGGQADDEAE